MTLIAPNVRSSDFAYSNPPVNIAVLAALILIITIGMIKGKLRIATRVAPWEPFDAMLDTIVKDMDKAVLDNSIVTQNNAISLIGFPITMV